ncbi:polysaccharide biosynthesis tyrosine autokinase [Microbacterium sp. LRZ72]|uniref:polysaccharide biosynthesis tyrosine autokinase n=1 Tax=Microbacterium sp. LRZ72 TaxID=2942481 RepID=UPI0029A79FEA|nr:polysaccharide biosynthesis tyrosine autokinase [Microbacterium sp. LRZ72]MDX2377457.1 polysaccharide biosynthesis tyrosine autokinase [Microbacterium sp. LRZ72]
MKSDASGWTLARVVEALRKFWLLIVALTVAGGIIAFGWAMTITPVYQSTATLYFALNQGDSASDLAQGSTYTQNQMVSFAQLATSSRVLEPVIRELDLDVTPTELARSLEVSIPQQTVILEVQASSTDAEEAAEIANAISDSLTQVVREVAPKGAEGAATIAANVIDEAVVPPFQAFPNKPREAALGALLGLLVGVLAAFVFTIADTRLRSEQALTKVSSAPVLGTITRTPNRDGSPQGLVVAREPLGHTAEEYRRIQSGLTYAGVGDRARCVLVTSSVPTEGKSTVTANLALTLAGLQHRVLLIDADLRRPRIGEYFGVENALGLTTVLVGELGFDVARITRTGTTLDLLPSGAVPPNPPALLASGEMRDLLQRVSDEYDFVLIDSPPVLSVADATLVAPMVDGVVVVIDASRTRRAQLASALRMLDGAGARLLGVVLNKTRAPRRRRSYYSEDARTPATGE